MLLIKKRTADHALEMLTDEPGHPVTLDDATRMMELYVQRLDLAEKMQSAGINSYNEPSHVFFNALALRGLGQWSFVGIAFALAVKDGDTHRPPTEDEAISWGKDPSKVELIQTVVIAEADDTGKFLFDPAASYELYDFAGQCCNLRATAAKRACIRTSFVRPRP